MLFIPWYVFIVLISVLFHITTFGQAYNRINEKQSSIGAMALKIIKSHINTLSDDQSGREWLRWAIRIDGPLFFKVPTPYDCPSDRKDPRYVVSNSIARHWNSRLKLRARLNSTESAGPPDVEVHSSACHAIPSPQVGFRCKAKSSAGLVFTCDGGGMSLKFEYLIAKIDS